jgi:alkanesulfonate monooxygenase SsuD/methylene tetrahydromethanopterin reductase-like flavin-dependent oxidoreductase (luciferase family)
LKLGLFPLLSAPIATPDYITTVAQAADKLGFNSLWAPEHVVLFAEHESRYPYSENGQIGVPPNAGILDPFEVLTFIAGVTKNIRIGTGIALVPQRNPVYTAKAAASLDWLSNGRFDFGIGIGWLKPTWQYPKPVQQPHPPLYFGGESDAALKRVAAVGDGWFGYNHDPASAAERLRVLDGFLAERGRSRSDIRILIAPTPRPTPELIEEFAGLGVDELILRAATRRAKDAVERMQGLAAELMPTAAKV